MRSTSMPASSRMIGGFLLEGALRRVPRCLSTACWAAVCTTSPKPKTTTHRSQLVFFMPVPLLSSFFNVKGTFRVCCIQSVRDLCFVRGNSLLNAYSSRFSFRHGFCHCVTFMFRGQRTSPSPMNDRTGRQGRDALHYQSGGREPEYRQSGMSRHPL